MLKRYIQKDKQTLRILGLSGIKSFQVGSLSKDQDENKSFFAFAPTESLLELGLTTDQEIYFLV